MQQLNVAPGETVAISCGDDHRYAALFCERVLPFNNSLTVPDDIKILMDPPAETPELKNLFDNFVTSIMSATEENRPATIDEQMKIFFNNRAIIYQRLLSVQGVQALPFFYDADSYNRYVLPGTAECIEVKLLNAPLIDISNLEWKHISQLRMDPDFRKKLRAFRLLLADDYTGKSIGYVRDDLLKRVDDYEETCRRNGLDLVVSSCSSVLTSKSLVGSLGLATAGILSGLGSIAVAAAVGGVALEIGKLAVHVAQKKLDQGKNPDNGGVAYLAAIRKSTFHS